MVKRASQVHQVPQIVSPQMEPVTSASVMNIAPSSADARAAQSQRSSFVIK